MDCLGLQFYSHGVGKKKSFLLFLVIDTICLNSHLLRRAVGHGSAASHERVTLPNEHTISHLGTVVAVAAKIWMADEAIWLPLVRWVVVVAITVSFWGTDIT